MEMALSPLRWVPLLVVITEVFSDIGSLIDCEMDVRCKGKDPVKYPYMFKPTTRRMSRCFCDEDCAQYRECCMDRVLQSSETNKIKWSCVPRSQNETVYAVSNCIQSNQWKLLCEKEYYPPKYGHLVDIPFYWNVTGRYYANIFCAYCDPQIGKQKPSSGPHNINLRRLTTKCTANITKEMFQTFGVYQEGALTWKVGNDTCVYSPEVEVPNGRPCVPSISSCPEGTDSQLSMNCSTYSLLIPTQNKVYRNPHCALCNGLNETDLTCKTNIHQQRKGLPSFQGMLGLDMDINLCSTSDGITIEDNADDNCTAVHCQMTNCTKEVCSTDSCKHPHNRTGIYSTTYVCLSLSIVCLLIHVYRSIFVSPPDNMPAKFLNSLAWSLLIAQTLLFSGVYPLVEVPDLLCYLVAILIEYFFLASFFWMNVISIDIWKTFSNTFNLIFTSYTKYAIYAWGGAAFFTVISIVGDHNSRVPKKIRPNYSTNSNRCWYGNPVGLALFFGFPVILILFLNCILFVMTISKLRKQHCSSERISTSGRKQYNTLLLFIKLSTIMGLTWMFAFILNLFMQWSHHGYPFIILNGLQGPCILIIFDLKTEKFIFFIKRNLLTFYGKRKIQKEESTEL